MTRTLDDPTRLRQGPEVGPLAVAPLVGIAAAVTCLLLLTASRYGYHRDELYFLAAGRHLAWGYPDQPPLVPLLARLLSAAAPHSVAVLRIPSAIAAGATALLAGVSARELGAGRSAQLLASASMAVGAVLLGSGHLLSTATFNFLCWSVLLWLVVRLLRTGDGRLWLAVGGVAGIGLLDSNLVVFLMAALVVGVLVVGPRQALRSPWLWIGGAIAALMWSPYLAWQAGHGWPQFAVSRSIAAGNSGSSQPRALLLPEQLVLLSPWVAPIWISGLVRLLSDQRVRWARSVGVGYLGLAVVFTVTGGKSYYLAGMFPVLLGAGSQPAVDWVRRARWRRTAMGTGLAVSAAISAVVTLSIVPVSALHRTSIVSTNYDAGETVGWPAFVSEIGQAYRQLPAAAQATTAIVGSNYGEAGAVDRYGPALGLPHAYGVHNGYWYWGPPPGSSTSALAIGFSAAGVARFCATSTVVANLDNHLQVADDEQRAPVWFCPRLLKPWAELWPHLKAIG